MKRRFTNVSIIPNEYSLGRCSLAKHPGGFHPDWDDGPKIRSRIEAQIVIDLAGFEAERLFAGRADRVGASNDMSHVVDTVTYISTADEKKQSAYIGWLQERTRVLLQDRPYSWHWAAVQALAGALLRHQRIGERKARRIISEAKQGWMDEHLTQGMGTP